VRMVGSPSWQLSEAQGDRAHVLLYIRDVAALEVPAELDAPPRLVGLPPHGSPVLDDDRRRRAGPEWADWWQALLEAEGREQTGTYDDDDSSFWAWAEDLGRVWDAPEFSSLVDQQALREVTLVLTRRCVAGLTTARAVLPACVARGTARGRRSGTSRRASPTSAG
jgi:hypothetical protein